MECHNITLNLRQTLSSISTATDTDCIEGWSDERFCGLDKSSLCELTKHEPDEIEHSAMNHSEREESTCFRNAILVGIVALASITVMIGGFLIGFSALAYFLPEAAFIPTMLGGTAFCCFSLVKVKQRLTPLFQRALNSHQSACKEYHLLAEELQRKKIEPLS